MGKRLFFNSEFLINQYVLDPRPETETLIEHVLEEKFFNLLGYSFHVPEFTPKPNGVKRPETRRLTIEALDTTPRR